MSTAKGKDQQEVAGQLRAEISALRSDNQQLRERLAGVAADLRDPQDESPVQARDAEPAASEARSAQQELAVVLERVTDAFVALDNEWRYTYVNARAGEMIGRRPEELVGKHIWTEFPEGLGQPFHLAYERAMTEQRIIHLEDYYAPWERWFENIIYPSPEGLSIYFHDITERKQVAAREQQQWQRLMDIIEFLPDATFVIDQDKRVVAWNRACEDMTGVKKQAMLGHSNYAEPFFGERRPILVDLLDLPVPEVEAEYKYVRRDGDMVVAESFVSRLRGGRGAHLWGIARPLLDKHGQRWGAVEVIRDVTERQEMEQALQRSQARLLQAQRIAHVGFLDWDLQAQEVYLSDEACALTGFDPEGQVTTPRFVSQSVHPDDLEYVGDNLALAMQGVKPYDIVHRHIRPDGTIVWVHAQAELSRDEHGAPARMLGTIIDISGLKLVEQALRDSEVKHRSLFETASDAIFLVRGDRFIDCNARTLTMFGCTREDIIGEPPHRFSPPTQPDGRPSKDMALEKIELALTEGPQHFEWEHCRHDRTSFAAEVTLNRIDLGDEVLLQATVRDITERKKVEDELERNRDHLEEQVAARTRELADARDRAESADRLKSAFLAAMSHELRTPLNSIIGFTGILMQEIPGPLNDEQGKQLGMVQVSARHLLALINDVLDISKIEAGQLELHNHRFDFRKAIESVLGLVAPAIEKKGLLLVVDVAAGVGEVMGDRRRVEQILLNLLSNAIKFTSEGEIAVRSGVIGEVVQTSIADQGIGVDAEAIPLLFKPFRQLETGLARRYEGTGLGLSICKRLVDLMGGSIGVVSELGAGSTFTFSLPSEGPGGNSP